MAAHYNYSDRFGMAISRSSVHSVPYSYYPSVKFLASALMVLLISTANWEKMISPYTVSVSIDAPCTCHNIYYCPSITGHTASSTGRGLLHTIWDPCSNLCLPSNT
jgi:hypothetical protein